MLEEAADDIFPTVSHSFLHDAPADYESNDSPLQNGVVFVL